MHYTNEYKAWYTEKSARERYALLEKYPAFKNFDLNLIEKRKMKQIDYYMKMNVNLRFYLYLIMVLQ